MKISEIYEKYKIMPSLQEHMLRVAAVASLRKIEKQIFVKCKMKPEDINDETIKPIISSLKNFVIQQ